MDQPARWRSTPPRSPRHDNRAARPCGACGFLLIEATLTVTVLAVGLVFIARGLGNSLKTLSALEQSETLRQLAESQFAELETHAQQGQPLARTGSCAPPQAGCRWTLQDLEVPSPDIPDDIQPSVRLVTLTVTGERPGSPKMRLQTIWPAEWLQ